MNLACEALTETLWLYRQLIFRLKVQLKSIANFVKYTQQTKLRLRQTQYIVNKVHNGNVYCHSMDVLCLVVTQSCNTRFKLRNFDSLSKLANS